MHVIKVSLDRPSYGDEGHTHISNGDFVFITLTCKASVHTGRRISLNIFLDAQISPRGIPAIFLVFLNLKFDGKRSLSMIRRIVYQLQIDFSGYYFKSLSK